MGGFNFAGGGQQVVNSAEDIDSPDKQKARDIENKADREKLKADFFSMEETQDIRQSISKNEKINEQDKNNLFERLITQLGKAKKNGEDFNIAKELKTILNDGTLPLKSGPRAKSGESLNDFSKRNQDFKQELYNSIMEPIEKTTTHDKIKEYNSVEAAPYSCKKVVGETCETLSHILQNPNPIEEPKQENKADIEKKMQENLGFKSGKELGEKLYSTESRINNQKQATELFFSPEKINKYSKKSPELEEFSDNIFKGGGMDEDLREILGNFVIDSEGTNLSDLDPKSSSEALNNAFDLEVAQLLEGKVNYKEKTVEKLRAEMLNESTNPLEKLLKFKKIKSEVNTSIGAIANKISKLQNRKTNLAKEFNKRKKLLISQGLNNLGKDKILLKLQKEHTKIVDEINRTKKIKTGEANMGGSNKLDVVNNSVKKISQNA